eukprot:CAMPEP_0204832198 /NCGR_PEP_ID=MMETSP1346-20131115/12870_1 /ASSEMBLY_ACC=CAM_ASM_000771 /TAXON_ID=215587 /ORGANISM="Aplanochytrium stocchinoi, Strain GSBS06" /LENGTH=407 /DNA_ID=CAMNT_0051963843 /DNA_START=38 /DNA_END=1261 /DNA_ORIENTATION=+
MVAINSANKKTNLKRKRIQVAASTVKSEPPTHRAAGYVKTLDPVSFDSIIEKEASVTEALKSLEETSPMMDTLEYSIVDFPIKNIFDDELRYSNNAGRDNAVGGRQTPFGIVLSKEYRDVWGAYGHDSGFDYQETSSDCLSTRTESPYSRKLPFDIDSPTTSGHCFDGNADYLDNVWNETLSQSQQNLPKVLKHIPAKASASKMNESALSQTRNSAVLQCSADVIPMIHPNPFDHFMRTYEAKKKQSKERDTEDDFKKSIGSAKYTNCTRTEQLKLPVKKRKHQTTLPSTESVNSYEKKYGQSRLHTNVNNQNKQRSHSGTAKPKRGRPSATPSSSLYNGVCWNKVNHKWQAQIYIPKNGNKKKHCYKYLGLHDTERDAALAFDRGCLRLFGTTQLERLNFPEVSLQ